MDTLVGPFTSTFTWKVLLRQTNAANENHDIKFERPWGSELNKLWKARILSRQFILNPEPEFKDFGGIRLLKHHLR